jgi:multiple sugar transport system ATP-binding protein
VKRLGVTSIYVTHDQAEAMTMGDRVAVMNAGEVMQIAPPRRIYEDPANSFVASFMGTPPMNLIALECAEARLPAWLGERDRVLVGFRPEHARLDEAEQEGGVALRATVRSVEPLGPETLVYLRAGEHDVRARVPGFGGPAAGADATIAIAPEHLLFFDVEDGLRLEEQRS